MAAGADLEAGPATVHDVIAARLAARPGETRRRGKGRGGKGVDMMRRRKRKGNGQGSE